MYIKPIDWVEKQQIYNNWTSDKKVFDCPNLHKTPEIDIFRYDPCSGCAHPDCPKHTKIIC